MKKSKVWVLCVLVMAMVIACGPASEAATPEPERTEAEGDVFPRATITPMPQNEDEANESVAEPAATAVPDDYPAEPEAAAQSESPYPGDEQIAQPESAYPAGGEPIWIVFPVGVQCEEGSGLYANLDEAVAALDAAEVIVVDQGTVSLMVASACGQPTSEHYQVQILAEGLEQARNLGWEVYRN